MRVELTDDARAFVARDWSPLVERDPSGTFFHTPAYLKLWWEEFGSGQLVVARARDGRQDVAACVFEIVGPELRFLGGFDVTDYMGPVGLSGSRDAVAAAMLEGVESLSWSQADLRGLPEDSAWLAALARAAGERGLRVRETDDRVAPILPLPPRRDDYLHQLAPKLRHEIRRKQRRLVQEAGDYRITLSTPDTVQRDLDAFFELHRASPGPKGRFMHEDIAVFFTRIARAFEREEWLRLTWLEREGRALAGMFSFAAKKRWSVYNSAYDHTQGELAPGMVLMAETIRLAAEEGCELFDMLRGDEPYKYRFGAVDVPLIELKVARA